MNRARAWQDPILCIQSADSSANLSAENNPQLNAALAIAEAVAGCHQRTVPSVIYEQPHFRTFELSHDHRLMLQERRKEEEQSEMAEAELLLKLPEKEQAEAQEEAKKANAPAPAVQPYHPAPDGFIFQMLKSKSRFAAKSAAGTPGTCSTNWRRPPNPLCEPQTAAQIRIDPRAYAISLPN